MIHVGKNVKKALAYLILLTGILSGAVFVFAQFSENAYVVNTIHVFPSEVEADGWKNASTLSFQNLDEYALLQEFNAINSATLDLSNRVLIEKDRQQNASQAETEEDSTTDTADTTEEPDAQEVTDVVEDNASSTESSPEEITSSSTETEVIFDVLTDDSVEDTAPETDVTTSTPAESEESAAPDEATQESATTTVMKRAQSVFKLAMSTVTAVFDSATNTPANTSETEAEQVAESLDDSVGTSTGESESEPEVEASSDPESEVATSSEAVNDTESGNSTTTTPEATATTTPETEEADGGSDDGSSNDAADEQSGVVDESVEDPQTEPCVEDCKSYVITLDDFGYPLEDTVEVSGAQLRMSFAAAKKTYKDRTPSLEVRYSMDSGVTWESGGSVVIDDEVSNSINGGYFLFALPEVSDGDALDSLQVELSFNDDPDLLKDLFVESVWLELFTLEAPEDKTASENFAAAMLNDGFDAGTLSGDELELPDGKIVEIEYTDENEDENLIIKSDKVDYAGLTKATTYFSVTNQSDKADDFTLQTYFPEEIGEVVSIREYNRNNPKEVVVPEYRPFVYHCEAGWEFAGEVSASSLEELSQQLFPTNPESDTSPVQGEVETSTTSTTPEVEVSASSSATSTPVAESEDEVEFGIPVELAPENEDIDFSASNTTTTVRLQLPSMQRLLQSSTSTPTEISEDEQLESNDSVSEDEDLVDSYACRNTNVVRTCDSIAGDNTACRIENMKVADHTVTKYVPGWESVGVASGTMPKPSLLRRAAEFVGFGPNKKDVPAEFEVRTHSENEYSIQPGETKYFEMEIRFPEFSSGEYWIEAVGQREYGLLDPFWSSSWDYRMPIEIDNTANSAPLDEDQVFLELDSSLTDFWNEVNSDGSDVRFAYEIPGNTDQWFGVKLSESDWYHDNWQSRIPFTIQASQVSNTLTDFPVYVDLATLGADFFSEVQNDGDDIRVTLADGLTEVPYELVEIDTGAETGELYFKAPTVSASTDTSFYIYFDNIGAPGYSDSAEFGPENVWNSNYEAVYHLSDFTDSTNNDRDGSSVGTPTQTNGAYDLDGNTDFIQIPSNFGLFSGTDSFTWQARFVADAVAPSTDYLTSPVLISTGGESNAFFTFGDGEPGDTIGFRYEGWTTPVTAPGIATGVDYRLTMSYNQPGADMRMYLNGSQTDSFAGTISVGTGAYGASYIGGIEATDPDRAFDGRVNEVRILSAPLSAGWVAAEDTNMTNPSVFYATSSIEVQPAPEEIGEWSHRTKFTVQASALSSALTDFPVYVDLSDFGAEFFAQVQSDGGDIRITKADGLTELPYELVDIDTGAQTGEVHFKADVLSDVSDTDFYIYYGNIDAPAHAEDSEYGADNVWPAEYLAVYHMEEDASGRGNDGLYTDSTSNGFDADDELVSTGKTGKLGRGQEVRSRSTSPYEYLLFPSGTLNGRDQFTASFWLNTAQTGNQALLNAGADNDYLLFLQNNNLALYSGGANTSVTGFDTPIVNQGWRLVTISRDATNNQWRVFVDGVEEGDSPLSMTMSSLSVPADCFMMGGEQDSSCLTSGDTTQHYDGLVDEVVFRSTVPSTAELQAEFANQSDTTSFYATSSVETLRPTTFTELDFWVQHFDDVADEADIWVQVSGVDANATGTIYMYYGSSGATSASDQYSPFTYSEPRDLYYIVNDSQTSPIVVYSYIDNNSVSIDGNPPVILDSGESTSFATYASTSVIQAHGPITARTADDSSEPPVPISFASTTHIVPTNRNNEDFYVYSPFATANVNVYEAASGVPSAGSVVAQGAADTYNVNIGGNNAGIVESDEPILLYHNNDTDSYAAYPPTLRDLYGIYSNTYNYSVLDNAASVTIYCSSGATGVTTGMTRGGLESNDFCTSGAQGAGNAVRLTGQTSPMGAAQQADSDGNESSRFLPTMEFAERYIIPSAAEYVSIACAPRFGASTIELRDVLGTVLESGTCTPSGENPGKLLFTAGTQYVQGTQIVSSNGVPFYMYYEDLARDDETNTWGAVQARSFLAEPAATFGAQENAISSEFEQISFRWYESVDAQTPVSAIEAEDVALVTDSAINVNDVLRLRMNVRANTATATLTSTAFKLQYSAAETCSLATEWHDVGDASSSTAAFRGYDNSSTRDGSVLSSLLLSQSDVAGTYEEENLSSFIQTEIATAEIAEWDWSIQAANPESSTSYCFRMALGNGDELYTYSGYPRLETTGPPSTPESAVYFDNERTADLTPVLEFSSVDSTGDEINYQVQIDNDVDFSSTIVDRDSTVNFLDFENISNPSDKAPFSSGAPIRFTSPSAVSSGQTYWWRARARDPDGSDSWGDWSAPMSFTTDPAVTVSQWHQTTGEQFSTNELTSVGTSSGAASVSGSGGTMKSTAIDFDDATVGNAWGDFEWNDTESSGTILYQVEYLNGSSWSLIPEADLTGNAAGFGTSPVNLLSLSTDTYRTIRLVANFSGSTLSVQDWTVRWGQRVDTPTLITPFDHEKIATTTPVLRFTASDPENDDLEYEISYGTDNTFVSSTAITTGTFASGAVGNYSIPSGTPLTNGVTYWWRARAKDPAGGNAYSPWSTADSFTVDTSVAISTWFQTTQEQFRTGSLEGAEALATDEVSVSARIGEYGTVTVVDDVWTTVNTSRSYNDMVVVASPEYASDGATDGRTVRVRNKTSDSFEILVDSYTGGFTDNIGVDYIVMESGTWSIEVDGSSAQVVAGTAEAVSEVKTKAYNDTPGTQVVFAPAFSAPPAVLATVSSENDASWVGTVVDAGNGAANEVGVNDMFLSLGRSIASGVHDPEDIDYIAFAPADGTNDGVEFESFNSPDTVTCCGNGDGVNYQTAFATVPAVTVVHNNANDGGDGGFAVRDTTTAATANTVYLEVIETGPGAGSHTAEIVSVVAFEDASGFIVRDTGGLGGNLQGTMRSEAIDFTDGSGPKFEQIYWNDTTPGASTVMYQVEYLSGDTWSLIPNGVLPGNSAGTSTSPIDMSDVDVSTYGTIRLVADMECASGNCPAVQDWSVEWAEGVSMSGTLQANDLTTSIASGTIRVAVNGNLLPSTGTVSAGLWTINNVTAFAGDAVTVFVDGAADEAEAVSFFVYDGTGNMTGIQLFEQYLSISADETATTTNALLSSYDYSVSGDEDIFFEVGAANDLTTCAVGNCLENSIYIGTGNVYRPDSTSSGNVSVHRVHNDGRLKLDGNTVRVSGSWENNSVFSPDTSTVIFTATSTDTSGESWYDEDWGHRVPVTITSSEVDGALTDFPVYVDLSDLPSAFFSDVQTDGDDIRVTTADAQTEVPFELVSIDTGAETGELHFKAPALSDTADTVFYVYYDNPAASAYADAAPYGRNNVWSNGYEAVYHLGDGDSTASNFYVDSTGNGNDGTLVDGNGNTSTGVGRLGQAMDFNGDADYIDTFTNATAFGIGGANTKSISAWAYTEAYNDGGPFSLGSRVDNQDYTLRTFGGVNSWRVQHWGGGDHDFTYTSQNVWVHFALDYNGTVSNLYANGVNTSNATVALNTTNDFDFRIGSWHNTNFFDGRVDEVRLAAATRSVAWYAAEHSNQNQSSTFYSVGTETSVPAITTAWTLEDASGTLTFNNLTFGESASVATWQSLDNFDVNGNLSTQQGTLNRSASTINVAGNILNGVNGKWSGVATTTFDGAVARTWTDTAAEKQNIGHVVVDGSAKTVTINSSVLAQSITIGANDTFSGGGSNDIQILGNFTNTNVFVPSTSRLVVTGAATNAVITTGGSNLYAVRASSTGGSVSFAGSSVTLLDNLEIATGTVTMPTTLMRIGGSLLNTGGAFAHNNSEVLFTGAGTETIQLQGTAFLNAFFDVRFAGNGNWTFTDTNATTTGKFVINQGQVTLPGGQLSVGRDFLTNAPGTFVANNGEVLFLTKSTDSITTNASEFNDVRFREGAPVRGGGFDPAWLYRDVVVIDSGEIDNDLTDFPVYLNLADFDPSFFSGVRADGGDIRITQSDGVTELPREVVDIDTGTQTGELYFKAPTLSSTTNATFYVYYGNAAAADYAITDTYGAENVWDDDFLAVYHMENINAVDSTSFSRDAVAVGDTPVVTSGLIGSAVQILDNGGSDYLDLQDDLTELDGLTEMSVAAWVNVTDDTNDDVIFARGGSGDAELIWDNIGGTTHNDTWTFNVGSTGGGNRVDAAPTGISVGDTWQQVVGTLSGSTRYIYVDGLLRNTTAGGSTPLRSNTGGTFIGYWAGSTAFDYDGLIDEYRISRTERSASWIAAEHNNMSDTTNFYSVVSGGSGSAARIFADANTTVAGDVIIESGKVQFPSNNLLVGGSFDNSGTFIANSGSVTFNSQATGNTIAVSTSTFSTLVFDGLGEWNITQNATATTDITLTDAGILTIDPGVILESTGTFANAVANASTTWTGSTLRLSGGGDFSLNDKNHEGDDYAVLEVTGDGDVSMWNSTAGTYATADTASIYSQDHSSVDGDLHIYGDYNRTSGTEHWSYATDFDGAALGSSSRQANVRMVSGAQVTMATSSLSMIGTETFPTTVAALTGSYGLTLTNATLNADHFTVSDTDSSGLELLASTTLASFTNGEFTVDVTGPGITIDDSTVATNANEQFIGVNFVAAGAGPTFEATGGVVTESGGYTYHTMTGDSVFEVLSGAEDVELLVVAGGGGGAGSNGNAGRGGGGAGGVVYDSAFSTAVGTYSVTVGAGGAGGAAAGASGSQGEDSTFGSLTAIGGGFGGNLNATGGNGGSGGGDGVNNSGFTGGTAQQPGSPSGGFGNNGGTTGPYAVEAGGGGGGGAGAAGGAGDASTGGAGGVGVQYSQFAVVAGSPAGWFAGGGGASGGTSGGAGGTGGGGVGGSNSSGPGSGVANTGGGGGGGGSQGTGGDGGAGGSGVVIVRYETPAAVVGLTNVALSGTSTDYVWFRDGIGSVYGEDFDDDDANPGAIRWDDSSYQTEVSGVVYADDGVTPLGAPTCDGVTENVRIVIDGGTYTDTTSCDSGDGSYSFTGVEYVGDSNILVYLNTNGGVRGSTVTKTPTGDILDYDVYANRVIVRHESSVPFAIDDMNLFDETNDTDVRFVATDGVTDTLTVRPDTELLVYASSTFAPGGNVTLQSSGSGQVYDGSLHIDDNATFLAAGTQAHSIGGSFFNDAGSTFVPASSTVTFTSNTTGRGITKLDGTPLTMHEVLFTGAGGGWNSTADLVVLDDMTISAGTVTGTGDITLENGQLSGAGLLSMGGGTTTIKKSSTLGGAQSWTFYDLVLGDGSTVATTTRVSTATTTVSHSLVIAAAHSLDAGASIWNLAGTGSVFTEAGNLLQDTSTFVYSGGGLTNVLSTNYYNLHFGGVAGTPVYRFSSVGVLVENNLQVSGGVSSEVDLNSNDPVVAVQGDVLISGNGNLSLSNSTPLTISGSYDNNATLTANTGSVVFDSADAYTIAAGASAFADVTLVGTGDVSLLESATSTGIFTISSDANFTFSNGILAVGGEFVNEAASTDWGSSTLFLYGGGNYEISDKNYSDTYATLKVGENTHIRVWNSDATQTQVVESGSLYSMDHAGVDGDLYIYGSYTGSGSTDYWNYADDFDGADLSGGNERQVNVYFATAGEQETIVYTANDTFVPPAGVTDVELLIVAGGGGGAGSAGTAGRGAGGAGGVIYQSAFDASAGPYTVTVGDGGAGGAASGASGNQGSNSSFGSLTAIGGGFGGNLNVAGGAGGSGGGDGVNNSGFTGGAGQQPGSPSGGFGNNGGTTGPYAVGAGGGGGGGAGGAGGAGNANTGGAGGAGVQYSQFAAVAGSPAGWFGGGGGASAGTTGGAGGTGGGGVGGTDTLAPGDGVAGTGGGGGASQGSGGDGGDGGSGVVIVRYQTQTPNTLSLTNGRLEVVGDSAATTTIQSLDGNQYAFSVGGTAATQWEHVSVRDIDDAGVTFSGALTLDEFSAVDLLVENDNGSAMTVGATAITASPARTLSDIIFNSDTGVTGAVNVTATGTTLSGWRFTAHSGNLDGEADDVDPAGDPGYIIWDDSAAIISISGNVYEADGTTVSSVCDDSTPNILLAIAGSLAQNASSSCSSSDGSYTISGVSFGSQDELMMYINGETDKGVTVTKDPISSIADADIYENHVIVRHENADPMNIADMAVWDSSNDADIPFTAIDAGTDTLSVPANTKLLVWSTKTFTPEGNITLVGGGAGASYDGSFEAQSQATFVATGAESHSIDGSFEFASNASFAGANSALTFTSDDAGRLITLNEDALYDATFTGSGSWTVTDSELMVQNDLTVSAGALTLPAATSTIGGSFVNTGTVDTNNGLLYFTAASGNHTVALGGSDAADVVFDGGADWTMTDVNATTTESFVVTAGNVTLPAGVLAVGSDFIAADSIAHNSGTIELLHTAGDALLTLSGNDLYSVVQSGTATTTMTDGSAALLGDLIINGGAFAVATNTLSIGGSLESSAAVLDTASGTLLFNSTDGGEFVDVGTNLLYNAVFANASGGWTVFGATTTNNFVLSAANNFSLSSGETLTVGGVFQNLVGGSATDWSNTTVILDGANSYSVNTKNSAGDQYQNLVVTQDSDIKLWNSAATTTTVDPSSSVYSQDHAQVNGSLYIYGDFTIGTSTENWSYATDFDGSILTGGNRRPVTVEFANLATTTLSGAGSLNVVGVDGFETTIQSQDGGTYAFNVGGGSLQMNQYVLQNMNANGLNMYGSPAISSLSNGTFQININSADAITLAVSALDANPSLTVLDADFSLVLPATGGTNVRLSATSTNSWSFKNATGDFAGETFDVDGVTNCGSVRWDDSSCLLTEQTEYRWRYDNGGIDAPTDDWFDTDWDKRVRVRVANNDNTPYTNAVVKITLSHEADMQNDFEDLRFTAADGLTPIDFWIERFTSNSSADVWLEIPALPASETVSLFAYYGNSAAGSISSATNTMPVVDDFEDADISEYSGQTGLFQVDSGFAYGGSYGLELQSGSKGTRLNPGIARFDQTVSQGQTISFRQYIDTAGGSSDEVCTLFGVQSPASANQNYAVCLEQFGIDRVTLAKNVQSTDNYGAVTQLATSTVSFVSGWYEVEVDWQTNNTIDVAVYHPSGALAASVSAVDSTYTSGGYGFTSWGQNGGWDSFAARPTLTTSPSTFFGVEQVDGGAAYAAPQNQVGSGFDLGDTARLRVAIENTGLDITDQLFRLEYAAKGAAPSCSAVSGASYAAVPSNASCGSSGICMATSTHVANGAVTTDLLEVQRNTFTAGAFVEDPSNQTAARDLDQNYYTELEYALTVTTNASDQSYCFRVTDEGTPYDAYANIPELSLKFDPTVGAITLNNGYDISLLPGTTTRIYATGPVTDLNGAADLLHATATIYRSGVAGGAACTPDNNNCYISSTADSCQFTACAGNSCEVQCAADIYFHADPSDIGTYAGEEWQAFIEVEDYSQGYAFGSAPGVELTTLRAIDVLGAIDYGTLAVNSDTGSYNASTSIYNYGNVAADVEITGTDLSDGFDSVIPANQQKFATSSFTYSGCGSCEMLSSSSPVQIDIDLDKPAADTPPVTDDVYWGIAVPFGVNSVAHQGINVFTPVSP